MATKTHAWYFASGSNPNKLYETLRYSDGSLTCNCPGWTFQKKDSSGHSLERTCKHTRMVMAGVADSQCKSHIPLDNKPQQETFTETTVQTQKGKVTQKVRKIVW